MNLFSATPFLDTITPRPHDEAAYVESLLAANSRYRDIASSLLTNVTCENLPEYFEFTPKGFYLTDAVQHEALTKYLRGESTGTLDLQPVVTFESADEEQFAVLMFKVILGRLKYEYTKRPACVQDIQARTKFEPYFVYRSVTEWNYTTFHYYRF